jgi:hypothetical protein
VLRVLIALIALATATSLYVPHTAQANRAASRPLVKQLAPTLRPAMRGEQTILVRALTRPSATCRASVAVKKVRQTGNSESDATRTNLVALADPVLVSVWDVEDHGHLQEVGSYRVRHTAGSSGDEVEVIYRCYWRSAVSCSSGGGSGWTR